MKISELILKPHPSYNKKYGPGMIEIYDNERVKEIQAVIHIDAFHPGHVYDLLRQGKSVKVKLTQVEILNDTQK